MRLRRVLPLSLFVFTACLSPRAAPAQAQDRFNEELVRAFTFRNVGPFRMGARVSDIAVPATPARDHRYTFYVSTWTGGVFKTTNNGTTFEPVFDGQDRLTVGALAVAPSDPATVWVGTGDAFGSRSSYRGDGVYKSTDAGGSWTRMGLEDSHHISRVVVHPTNADVVFVAAMGHLYSPNEERGVFKTTDGGRNWERVLFVNDRVGAIDLVLHPQNPDVLYAATYDMDRLPWMYRNGGPESGIYKTQDGGSSWRKLTGGLPTGPIGRIGLALYPPRPDTLYAVVNNLNTRPPTEAEIEQARARGREVQDRTIRGEVYRTEDGGERWVKMNRPEDDVSPKGGGYLGSGDEDLDGFTQIRVDPNDDQTIFTLSVSMGSSTDGGRSWVDITWPPRVRFPGIFGDVRALWIDPEDSQRIILGSDASIFVSSDGGATSDHHYNLPVGEVYGVGVDMEDPYNVYAGLQDHEAWRAPSAGPRGDIGVLDWDALGSGDGMFVQVDPADSRWAYTTSEWGGIFRVDQVEGHRTSIRPSRPGGGAPYRFIWGTPFHMSPHDGRVIYTGGEVLLRSRDRGDTWEEVSPNLSTYDGKEPLRVAEGEVPTNRWFSVSAISESPLTRGVIWVGMSDGKVHLTRDDGAIWTDRTTAVAAAGGPEEAYVSRVRASNHAEGRAYLSKSGNKSDDFRPYLFRTDDYGATWRSVAGDLPEEPIHVVWEDHRNPDLLFVGNGTGVFVTIDGGRHWVKMNNNMPNLPVLDLLVHPRESDLVVGSWGRGLFITNIAPLQELTEAVLAEDAHLFSIKPTAQRIEWSFGANDALFAQRHILTPNEPGGMKISYYLRNPVPGGVEATITDARGAEVARLQGEGAPGINTVMWNMRAGGGAGGFGGGRGGGGSVLDRWIPLGEYTVTLEAGGITVTRSAQITRTQGWPLVPPTRVIRERP
jgi:photosystem II stability/assembly factor-like uncharacterized protein